MSKVLLEWRREISFRVVKHEPDGDIGLETRIMKELPWQPVAVENFAQELLLELASQYEALLEAAR